MRDARDPVLAGETFDDQPPPLGHHHPLQACPRLPGVRERLAPVDLPDRAHGTGDGVLERLDRRPLRPRTVRLMPHDTSVHGLDEMALARERTAGKTFELVRQARGERRLVPARELTAAAPPLAQLRDDCLGADRVGTAAGHAPVEDRVLGVEIAEPPEGAGFECGSQSLAKAHGHDARMLAPSVGERLRASDADDLALQEVSGRRALAWASVREWATE